MFLIVILLILGFGDDDVTGKECNIFSEAICNLDKGILKLAATVLILDDHSHLN